MKARPSLEVSNAISYPAGAMANDWVFVCFIQHPRLCHMRTAKRPPFRFPSCFALRKHHSPEQEAKQRPQRTSIITNNIDEMKKRYIASRYPLRRSINKINNITNEIAMCACRSINGGLRGKGIIGSNKRERYSNG